MRFLIINTDYPAFLRWLYARHHDLEKHSYHEQMRARMESLFGVADFYSANLRKLGHEAVDVICNNENSQNAWGREHGIVRNHRSKWRVTLRRGVMPWVRRECSREWLYSILEAQIKVYRPDVIYCMAIETIGSDLLNRVKGHYRLAVGQHAAPLPAQDIGEYDLILSSLPNQVDHFRKQGMKSVLFRLGFEPRILKSLSVGANHFGVVFVGGLSGHHRLGADILESLCQRFEAKVWGYGIERLGAESQIRKNHMGLVWGKEMYQILSDAKIVFNRHIDVAGDYANNMRLYEGTGVGTLLITDHKKNMGSMFTPGREVLTYRHAEECAELVEYYLEHTEEREAIALAGQERTLKEHTYLHRMQELLDIVRKYL